MPVSSNKISNIVKEQKLAGLNASKPRTATGILPYQSILTLIESGQLAQGWQNPNKSLTSELVQPASIDLRLGEFAYRVPASFLPGKMTVEAKIADLDGYKIDLREGAVLEKGCIYVIPLLESLDLSKSDLCGFANPKSSTGRLDILTRLITDRAESFDLVEHGYSGPLYVEVVPWTFSIVAKTGVRLNQLRFRRGSRTITQSELETLHHSTQTLSDDDKKMHRNQMLPVTIDLRGQEDGLIGFRAKRHSDRIDVTKIAHYDPRDFWEPITQRNERLVLDPGEFYILMTRESVGVPPDYAAEMVAYDTGVGEFRAHYAGFFDPGFGWDSASGKAKGSRAVLEVRSHEVPFLLEHGQTVGWLRYEPMAAIPDKLYGQHIGSNYQNQGLKLAKQFKAY